MVLIRSMVPTPKINVHHTILSFPLNFNFIWHITANAGNHQTIYIRIYFNEPSDDRYRLNSLYTLSDSGETFKTSSRIYTDRVQYKFSIIFRICSW